MAISEDRLKISQITKATVSDFSSHKDPPAESTSFGDGLVSNYTKSGNVFDGLKEKFSGVNDGLSRVSGTINSYMTGFESKGNKLVSSINDFSSKNLSFNTRSLGFFENLLCGNFPGLGLRLPNFLGMIKDINLGFNMTICNQSKYMNPIDFALSAKDAIRNPRSVLDGFGILNYDSMLKNHLQKELGPLGIMGTPDCLMDNSRWLSRGLTGPFGMGIDDRMWLLSLLAGNNCAGMMYRNNSYSNGLSGMSSYNILNMLSGYNNPYSHEAMNNLYVKNGYTTSIAASRMIGDGDNRFVYNQTGMLARTYTTGSDEDFRTVLGYDTYYGESANQELIAKYSSSNVIGKREDITPTNLIVMRSDTSNMFKSMATTDTKSSDPVQSFKNMVLVANVADPSWNRDQEGNISMYKTRNNPAIQELSTKYITTRVPQVPRASSSQNSRPSGSASSGPTSPLGGGTVQENNEFLTGNVTTRLDLAHQMAIVNSFPKDPEMQV